MLHVLEIFEFEFGFSKLNRLLLRCFHLMHDQLGGADCVGCAMVNLFLLSSGARLSNLSYICSFFPFVHSYLYFDCMTGMTSVILSIYDYQMEVKCTSQDGRKTIKRRWTR